MCCIIVSTPLHVWWHGISDLFNFRSSSGCAMASHHGFIFHFPDDTWCGAPFPGCICHLCIFSGEVSSNIFHPLLIRLFSDCWAWRVLYVSLITFLYQVCLSKYFLPVCDLSSHSIYIVCCWAENFKFNEFKIKSIFTSLPMLSFMDHDIGAVS